MKKYLLCPLLFFCFIGHTLTSTAATLEEQADKIESSKNDARKKISDIFNKYKNSLQITTGQPNVIDSDGNKVMIRMEVSVKLTDPNLSLQMDDTVKEYFSYPKRYTSGNNNTYLEMSIVSGGNQVAWDELTRKELRAEISFLDDKQSIHLFGSFKNWFTVKITEKEVFELIFNVDKKNINLNPTPTIRIITKICKEKGCLS
ncbi:MAG: hypothetical protein ACXWT1_04370 [Methylobacter sp.]